jgi:hypothetical protein
MNLLLTPNNLSANCIHRCRNRVGKVPVGGPQEIETFKFDVKDQ